MDELFQIPQNEVKVEVINVDKPSTQRYEQDVNILSILNSNMNHELNRFNHNLQNHENAQNNYWDIEANYNQIIQNEQTKYNFFKFKENAILSSINMQNKPIRAWRYKNEFFYRPSLFSDLISGTKEEIAKEIGSRYGNINICFVDDLNDVISNKKIEIRINTTYIAVNSIPVIDDEVFDPSQMEEIFLNPQQTSYLRNRLTYTSYLSRRFYDYIYQDDKTSTARYFIQNMTTIKDLKFLASRFGNFFKHLFTSNAIVLIGNKDVSEDVLLKRILKPIFGSQFCITLTDEILDKLSAEEIIKYKLIYHIDHIPKNEEHRKKLREILISILVDKFIQNDDKFTSIHGQVIVTIDEADPFLKDFVSSCDIFFVDSMQNIINDFKVDDKIEFFQHLHGSLDFFAEELSVIGNMQYNKTENDTDNQKFIKLLDDINEQANVSNIINNKNILDPFNDTFNILLPKEERYKHTNITGQTGIGKSILITTLIYSDILRHDSSVILLDPHGDLADNVVKLVQDKTRLVYIDPFMSDGKTPTIDLFSLNDKSELNIARVTQVILSVLKSINSDEKFTGAMEDVLENCIKVLLRKGGGSFKELYRFMNDNRNTDLLNLGQKSPNSLESEFFIDDFKTTTSTKEAVRRRLKKLLGDPIFSNLMNGENTINLDEYMNTVGKIIVFNIPKGKMPNTYKYYIRFIVEYLQILALKRADLVEENRVPTHLYIDEAHNFITSTSTISEILTESRKYRLYVTFAHQAITQIKNRDLRDILTTMTNVKIIGKNSNETLAIMNKTLNTKLEDVEKLGVGEFYISAGNNDIVKVYNTDKLLNDKYSISTEQWEIHKQYQLDTYYRYIEDNSTQNIESFDKRIKDFIEAIKSKDVTYFDKIKDYDMGLYNELMNNFNDEQGYISQPDLSLYFSIIYKNVDKQDNRKFIVILKNKDSLFKQDVKSNKKNNDKFRYMIHQ